MAGRIGNPGEDARSIIGSQSSVRGSDTFGNNFQVLEIRCISLLGAR